MKLNFDVLTLTYDNLDYNDIISFSLISKEMNENVFKYIKLYLNKNIYIFDYMDQEELYQLFYLVKRYEKYMFFFYDFLKQNLIKEERLLYYKRLDIILNKVDWFEFKCKVSQIYLRCLLDYKMIDELFNIDGLDKDIFYIIFKLYKIFIEELDECNILDINYNIRYNGHDFPYYSFSIVNNIYHESAKNFLCFINESGESEQYDYHLFYNIFNYIFREKLDENSLNIQIEEIANHFHTLSETEDKFLFNLSWYLKNLAIYNVKIDLENLVNYLNLLLKEKTIIFSESIIYDFDEKYVAFYKDKIYYLIKRDRQENMNFEIRRRNECNRFVKMLIVGYRQMDIDNLDDNIIKEAYYSYMPF